MADVDEKKAEEGLQITGTGGEALDVRPKEEPALSTEEASEGLGTDKWVFASFFITGIGVAFLVGKTLASVWNRLTEEPWVVRNAPILLRYPEDERPMFTTIVGGVVGIAVMIYCLRKEGVRRWADDVALELSKVSWPKRDMVVNNTIVVLAAGIFATVYIGLLDRLWGFVTMLVYGA